LQGRAHRERGGGVDVADGEAGAGDVGGGGEADFQGAEGDRGVFQVFGHEGGIRVAALFADPHGEVEFQLRGGPAGALVDSGAGLQVIGPERRGLLGGEVIADGDRLGEDEVTVCEGGDFAEGVELEIGLVAGAAGVGVYRVVLVGEPEFLKRPQAAAGAALFGSVDG
jgi:hypothetical protein